MTVISSGIIIIINIVIYQFNELLLVLIRKRKTHRDNADNGKKKKMR